MSASDIRAYLDEKEVLDGFELGDNQVIAATKTGICNVERQESESSGSEYDTQKSNISYSFVKYDSIEGITLNEQKKELLPNYGDILSLGFVGVICLIFSMIGILASSDMGFPGLIVSIGILVLAVVIAIQRNEKSDEGTTLTLLIDSDNISSDKWTFSSQTVDDKNFQNFVKTVSKNID